MGLHDFSNSQGKPPATSNGVPIVMGLVGPQPTQGDESDVTSMLVDYNDRFAATDPALFRDGVVAETMGALISQRKPNALLIGPAGAGKTAIVEEIARRIETKDASVPERLAHTRVMELPLAAIVAGSGIVGEIEQKLTAVIDYASDPQNDVVLFIDEIHQLVSRSETYSKMAQILKPALARGDLRVIGATTNQEARSLMNDPAFNRRFTRVIVDELTAEQTVTILELVWPRMNEHYGRRIALAPDTLKNVVAIADELGGASQHRPDNAITLLDRSCADATIRSRKAIAEATDPKLAAQLAQLPIPVKTMHIRQVAMRQATGHSVPDTLDLEALDDALERIKGQDRAIEKVRHALRRRDLGIFQDKRPCSMLFAGPSGVGKSEVARIVSDVLFHERPITLNMCEYADAASINKIIGSPQGYVGSDWNNELPFDTLDANPYRLILLDEFEKADRSVQRLFMSALEDGYVTTNLNKTIDFSHAIIVATTNAGHSTGASRACGFMTQSTTPDDTMAHDLSAWFDTELLNRFQVLTTFSAIDRATYATILADDWAREAARIKATRPDIDLADELDDETLERLVNASYTPEFGARPAQRAVEQAIEETLLA